MRSEQFTAVAQKECIMLTLIDFIDWLFSSHLSPVSAFFPVVSSTDSKIICLQMMDWYAMHKM